MPWNSGGFEVVLRNAINSHYQNYFNDQDWIRHQYVEGDFCG